MKDGRNRDLVYYRCDNCSLRKYSAEWRPGHVNEFCLQSFEYLLEQTGFELVVWWTYSNKPVANAFYRWVPIASKVRALVRKLPDGAAADRAA